MVAIFIRSGCGEAPVKLPRKWRAQARAQRVAPGDQGFVTA